MSERIVVVVEDIEACATILEITLQQMIPKVDVYIAATAEKALNQIAAGVKICAVITDRHLPSMDGFELIERIRRDARTNRLPIIVISGGSDPNTPERIYDLGAYSPARVRQTLERLLNPNAKSHSA